MHQCTEPTIKKTSHDTYEIEVCWCKESNIIIIHKGKQTTAVAIERTLKVTSTKES